MSLPNCSESECDGCDAMCCKVLLCINASKGNEPEFWEARASFTRTLEDGTLAAYLVVPCQHLDENNRCRIYETRPPTCKTFPQGWDKMWGEICPLMVRRWKNRKSGLRILK